MLSLSGVTAALGQFELRDANLHVPRGEYCCIIGPTGAGKTVTLECVTGLHPVRVGTIRIDGQDVTKLPPERRPLGYVPQDYALFPHLSVYDNIAYGLVEHRVPRAEIPERVESVARLLAIDHLLGRRPSTLSGGEAQRTALGRALVLKRDLLLMDEPFGALDQLTKRQLFRYLKTIHRDLGLTVVHITHDFSEAFGLAGMVAVVLAGRIRQVGTPEEVFSRPSCRAVASFLGIENVWNPAELDGQVTGFLAALRDRVRNAEPESASVCVVPDAIAILPRDASANGLSGPAVLREAHWRGALWELELEAGLPFRARVSSREYQALQASPGDSVLAAAPPESVHWIDD